MWCHNPETILKSQQVLWREKRCIGCYECTKVLDKNKLKDTEINLSKFIFDSLTSNNLDVVAYCPSKAWNFTSSEYSVSQLAQVIDKNKSLNQSMGGGITFSGGEPALQSDFISEVIAKVDDKSLHLALDTCGAVKFENYKKLLPLIDLLLFDIKDIDTVKHKLYTEYGNELIIQNIKDCISFIKEKDLRCRIRIRTPLIPSMTSREDNITGIANFIKDNSSDIIQQWDLCAFNNLCANKYKELGLNWTLSSASLLTNKEADRYLNLAKNVLKDVDVVVKISGLLKTTTQ